MGASRFRVNVLARLLWEQRRQSAGLPKDWPVPEVKMRKAELSEIPRAALAMGRAAQAQGWQLLATYARGTRIGRPPRVIDSLAVRMKHPSGVRAVAVWHDGSWDSGWVIREGVWPSRIGYRELLAFVRG